MISAWLEGQIHMMSAIVVASLMAPEACLTGCSSLTKLLHELLVLVELLQVLNAHVLHTELVGLITVSNVSQNADLRHMHTLSTILMDQKKN